MKITSFSKQVVWLFAIVGIFAFSGVAIFQLKTAFGWTNPIVNPPQGAGAIMVDPGTGNVGIKTSTASTTLTVNGAISALMHNIVNVATPTEDYDAANKLYVDAAAGGQTFTLFGIGQQTAPLDPQTGGQSYNFNIPGGTGTPVCPAGYGSILDGYGPHGVVTGSGWQGPFYWSSPDYLAYFDGYEGAGTWTRSIAPTMVAPTYSTCSASNYQIVPSSIFKLAPGFVDSYHYITAKACEDYVDNSPPLNAGFKVCNTCRVCLKGYQGAVNAGGSVPPDSRW